MNQQRTKTNEQGVRSETPASRWAVTLIHGALKTHPNLLVLSRGRPEMVLTDGHLDLVDFEDPQEATWTCDLLLLPQGINGQNNLAIEIKTSASAPSHEPFSVFAHTMGLERNKFQMSKIAELNKPWWYVVVLIDKLTASTDEEYASRMWACPTIWYQGLPGASFPNAALGPKPLSQIVVEMRNGLPLEVVTQGSSAPIKMSSRAQLTLPMDDVPVVTMDTPLYGKKPERLERSTSAASAVPAVAINAGGLPQLPSESVGNVIRTIELINAPIDVFAARLTDDEQLALKEVRCALGANPSDVCSINAVRSLFGVAPVDRVNPSYRRAWAHPIVPTALAVRLIAVRNKRARCSRHGEVFAEMYAMRADNIECRRNLASLLAMRLLD